MAISIFGNQMNSLKNVGVTLALRGYIIPFSILINPIDLCVGLLTASESMIPVSTITA